eukprot:s1462_g4.t4
MRIAAWQLLKEEMSAAAPAVLGEVQQRRAKADEASLLEVRQRAAMLLSEAAADGKLEKAGKTAAAAEEASQPAYNYDSDFEEFLSKPKAEEAAPAAPQAYNYDSDFEEFLSKPKAEEAAPAAPQAYSYDSDFEEFLSKPKEPAVPAAGSEGERALQLRIRSQILAALNDGSLEEALIGVGAGQGEAADDVRQRIEKQLIAALEDGSLEEAIQTSLAPSAPTPAPAAPVASSPRVDPKTVEEFSAKMFMEAFSEKGRRLDTLMRSIAEAEAQIKQREQRCQQLQAHVSQHKLELAHLDLDFEWCSKLLDSAEARRGELQAAQRKLLGTLHGKMYELADVTTAPLTSRAVEGSRSPRGCGGVEEHDSGRPAELGRSFVPSLAIGRV